MFALLLIYERSLKLRSNNFTLTELLQFLLKAPMAKFDFFPLDSLCARNYLHPGQGAGGKLSGTWRQKSGSSG